MISKRPSAIALSLSLALANLPIASPRANAQAVIGLPIVETIVIVGAAGAVTTLYVWYVDGIRNESSTYPVLPDPEEEVERMGRPQSETVTAGTQTRATELCEGLAKGRTLQKVQWFESNQWECIFY
jgi:hypothetical protein